MITRCDQSTPIETIVDALRRDGVCVLYGIYAGMLDRLAHAFEDSFIHLPPTLGDLVALNPREQRLVKANWNSKVAQAMPELIDIACHPLFSAIGEVYFRSAHLCAHSLYINECYGLEQRSANNQFKLHFDKVHSLKWFVYIDDVAVDDGPLEVVPGEQRTFLEARIAQYQGCALSAMDGNIDPSGLEGRIEPITGPAGTVILFDTDLPHRGGHVMPGRRRRIIRSHSCSMAMRDCIAIGRFSDGPGLRSHC